MLSALRSRLHHAILTAWYKPNITPWLWLLIPFSYLFLILITIRRWFYRRGWLTVYPVSVPIIIVGNITIGGTGKTPSVISLAQYLTTLGYQVGIISRGYGAKITKPQLVRIDSSPLAVGDEPLLIAKHTNCPVIVGPNRTQAALLLQHEYHCNLLISDDGLQHYALKRDIEIILLNKKRGLGNQQLLPAGPLREPATRLQQADFVLCNGDEGKYGINIEATGFFYVRDGSVLVDQHKIMSQPIHAVAAIGHPEAFFCLLREIGFTLIEHRYPDHYQFNKQDIQFNDDFMVVMTEKDAIKCLGLVDHRHIFLGIKARFSTVFLTELAQHLKRMLA